MPQIKSNPNKFASIMATKEAYHLCKVNLVKAALADKAKYVDKWAHSLDATIGACYFDNPNANK